MLEFCYRAEMHVYGLGKASKTEQRTCSSSEHVCKCERKRNSVQISECTWWLGWLRQWVKKWKVAGSIPGRVINIFHYLNPSSRTMTLGSN